MSRRDWLTLFMALEGAPDGLDPVRIQKGMFLFAMESKVPPGEKYGFAPYDYGPMSKGIYSDLDQLVASGAVVAVEVPGKTWSRFAVTDKGLQRGAAILRRLEQEQQLAAARKLHQIKRLVAGLSFNDLLDRVYDAYPDYATNSVFRRPA